MLFDSWEKKNDFEIITVDNKQTRFVCRCDIDEIYDNFYTKLNSKDCCWFSINWIAQILPRIISPLWNIIFVCAHLHFLYWLLIPYIHQIIHLLFGFLPLLTQSLLVELRQLCPRGLTRQIYKANNSVSFWDFLHDNAEVWPHTPFSKIS